MKVIYLILMLAASATAQTVRKIPATINSPQPTTGQ